MNSSLPLTRVRLLAAGPALAATLLLASCGSDVSAPASAANPAGQSAGSAGAAASPAANQAAPAIGATTSSPAVSAAPTTGTTSAGGATGATGAASGTTTVKVSANKASRAELQRAFEAAGIPNAARWAVEVEEYRPYPTNDPSWAKLRRELAKYNIAPATLEQIIATLTLD